MADIIALRRVRRRRFRLANISHWRLIDRDNPFNYITSKFLKKFRLSKEAVKDLCDELRPHMGVSECGYSIEMQVLSSLYFLGSGSFQHVTSDSTFAQISQPSVSRYLQKFVDAIWEVLPQHIKFPLIETDLLAVKGGFYDKWGFPNCIGALDCTHISIMRPTENDYFVFLNRHGRFSLNVQMVCDHNLRILDVVARWPGGSHDAFIWRGSSLREIFTNNFIPEKNFLLGDSGYPLEPWLMTPFATENTQRQRKYNETHRRARNVVERCFGVLKSRFRCLHDSGGILMYAPNKVCKVVIACAVLHNICIKYNISADAYGEDFDHSDTEDLPSGSDNPPLDTPANLRDKALRLREEISLHL